MSHEIKLPVVLRANSIKGGWQLAGEEDGIPIVEQHTFLDDVIHSQEWRTHENGTVYSHKLPVEELQARLEETEIKFSDPWHLLQDFTAIKTSKDLLAFLNSTGHFCDPAYGDVADIYWSLDDYVEAGDLRYGVTDFWQLQEHLAEMLLTRRPVIDITLIPERWEHAFTQGCSFHVLRRLGECVGELKIHDTLSTLIVITQIKVLQCGRFRVCKRGDCGRIFEVETRGRRRNDYCGHLCAHTAWQRRDRKTKVQVIDERLQFGYGSYNKARKGA
ncbi:MAG TPA: hypothetical protein VII23_24675 [Terriglobales bacterium]